MNLIFDYKKENKQIEQLQEINRTLIEHSLAQSVYTCAASINVRLVSR
jgi:hypothetical protein